MTRWMAAPLLTALGCAGGTEPTSADDLQARMDDIGLLSHFEADADSAAAGEAWLWGETTGTWGFPMAGFQALGLLDGAGVLSVVDVYDRLKDQYGFLRNPADPLGAPVGVRPVDSRLQFTCLSCHADRVAGEVVIGGSSGSVDWEALGTDLAVLANIGNIEVPLALEGFTGAPGTHDAWGLGYQLAKQQVPAPDINEDFGYQQSPAWWSRRFKHRLYLDGSGSTASKRTMAAMYLGYGASLEQIQAMEPDLDDAWAAMIRMPIPQWTLSTLDPELWAQGEALFASTCAQCHGHYSGGADRTFPDRVVDVGTDPIRHEQMRAEEVDFINASWFGEDAPFEPTEGYLAPVLHGVWATAPYFHNGSVPTLWAVLDSSTRPEVWARTGHREADYDVEHVGLRYDTYDEPGDAPDATRVYDTRVPGLSAAGHTVGDALSDGERTALIEYLKSL
ncbi:MAG: hypothetical protein KTR31_18565 [Myxococcales bacterium]|nr:hypothetical protein [Myxococcales bacterium]